MQVDVFVLHAAPQPLDEHVVDPAPLAVHIHAHALGQQRGGEVLVGELAIITVAVWLFAASEYRLNRAISRT
jgi:hypothetical protein